MVGMHGPHVDAAVVELPARAAAHELVPAGVPGHRRQRVLLRVRHLQVQLLRLRIHTSLLDTTPIDCKSYAACDSSWCSIGLSQSSIISSIRF